MTWLSDYTAAISARDAAEKRQSAIIAAYTKLADRTAATSHAPASAAPSSPRLPNRAASPLSKTSSPSRKGAAAAAATGDDASLRAELAATQKARAELAARVKPLGEKLATVTAQAGLDARRIEELSRERAGLERKVRDRDEEIKGKGKLVEEVQDEMLSLDLQLNMAEQRAKKLEQDNAELLRRWMALKRDEAEAMNATLGT
ncbi:autophagy-related protein 16 [Lineolata rhizophorae]|uniref:Autophagy-related protein 16 n=1 Tax=Lineolata rhizophorae TaxID=578093 RepID=A0A6A6PDJ7_9PEZI|nr:autophagy-related protein 16 [Lineolata rhizophorae]